MAHVRMAIAQFEREGLLVDTGRTRNGRRVYVAIKHAGEAKRAAAKRAREEWEANGRPQFTEKDLALFEDEGEAC